MAINLHSIIKTIGSLGAVFLLTACNHAQQSTPFLTVNLTSDTEIVKANEPFTLTVDVSYGDEDISEDTIVEIEFIENGTSLGSVNPKYVGDGIYELEMKLVSEGEHTIIAHVSYEDYYKSEFLSFDVT